MIMGSVSDRGLTKLPVPTDDEEYLGFLSIMPDNSERVWMREYYGALMRKFEEDYRELESALYEIEKNHEDGQERTVKQEEQVSFIQSCQAELSLPARYVQKILNLLQEKDEGITSAREDSVGSHILTKKDEREPIRNELFQCDDIIDFSVPEIGEQHYVRVNGKRLRMAEAHYLLFFSLCYYAKHNPGKIIANDTIMTLTQDVRNFGRDKDKWINEIRATIEPHLNCGDAKQLLVTKWRRGILVSTDPGNIILNIDALAAAGHGVINRYCKSLLSRGVK